MKILVPFDASAPAERVLRFAIGLARAHKRSRIIVVNVQNVAIYGESEVLHVPTRSPLTSFTTMSKR